MKRRVLMFCPAMVPAVESGDKLQTIRKHAHCEPGDILSLRRWTCKPYRSKQAIIKEASCIRVSRVVIDGLGIVVKGHDLDAAKAEVFANSDGFDTLDEMIDFFRRAYGLPFTGDLIEWREYKKIYCGGEQ